MSDQTWLHVKTMETSECGMKLGEWHLDDVNASAFSIRGHQLKTTVEMSKSTFPAMIKPVWIVVT